MAIEVRPAAGRYRTTGPRRTTWHSFSFGEHYDAENVGFGPLVAHNDEWLRPGGGYPEHRHDGVEIVTIVVSGMLRHRDAGGVETASPAGTVRVLSAGAGVVHAELAGREPARFVQLWLRAEDPSQPPREAEQTVDPGIAGLVTVAGPGALALGTPGCRVLYGRLADDDSVDLPDAPLIHVFVATGAATLGERLLTEGDAARLRGEPGRQLTSASPETLAVVVSMGA